MHFRLSSRLWGYASYNNFAHVIENVQYFLIRCTDKKAEKILGRSLEGVQALDTHMERILSRSQSKKKRRRPELAESHRHICGKVPMDYLTDTRPEYDIALRAVRFELFSGSYENLITNLPDQEIDMDAEGLIASNIEAVRPGRTFPRCEP